MVMKNPVLRGSLIGSVSGGASMGTDGSVRCSGVKYEPFRKLKGLVTF